MESLLRWGIQNSATGSDSTPADAAPPRRDLDPGIIDAILGKSDSELMKEALAVAVDESRDEDERIQALDDFEMLIEQIDNANNIEKLKMWDALHGLLTLPSSTDGIKMQALWIIGTAVQNNPSAQASYLALNPMPALLLFLDPSVKSGKLRSKAVYALSGLLKHNAAAVKQFDSAGGWQALKGCLEDSDITVRRKTAFLLNTLIVPTIPVSQLQSPTPAPSQNASQTATGATLHTATGQPPAGEPVHPNSHAAMQSNPEAFSTSPAALKALEAHGILQALVSSLTSPTPHGADGELEEDADFEEKITRSLHTYVTTCDGKFSESQKGELRQYLQDQTARCGGEPQLAERWALTQEEVRDLKQAVV
ncbi:nucleotide exchange factors-like protein [Wolfiporia cocos MD-104 SS10]|uniref:Nucleotide exchange factors-like protein n=1 Tax=Wolfiporia cocos (strain MD-104) TaxID=742152 RepID=A0A2H3JMN9_WOLCO|nr:nucleotide exchange factors-like protein [Wolfiporia cocos MD-104 SS10]